MAKQRSFSLLYRLGQLGLDSFIAWFACSLAFFVRFEGNIAESHQTLAILLPLIAIPGRLLSHWLFGLYQQIWRLFGLRDSLTLMSAVTFYSLALLTSTRLIIPRLEPEFVGIPLGVAVIDWCFCLMGMMAIRYTRRRLIQQPLFQKPIPRKNRQKTVLLVGAGRAGAMMVREARDNPQLHLKIVGFLDDDPTKLRRKVEGIQILGKTLEILTIATAYDVDEVIISMPSARASEIRRLLEQTQGARFTLKVLPSQSELLLNRSLTPQAREIQIQDILGRPEIRLNFADSFNQLFPSASQQIYGKTVMVTGAGGTIGSEICRQIARLNPQCLLLLGRGEYSIFKIEQELKRNFPHLTFHAIIADIRHQTRMKQLFQQWQPQLIFHAAAHKHVPLMENNPTEAIANNTIASAQLAQLAVEHQVESFVMISTDKAVDSTNFMGLSKRLAELMVTALSAKEQTRFLVVRFGNVLGSRGSVVPIFQAQIARGGPVTVTDAEMTRYFMTTPEASQLVIQSLAVGKSGQILILDMGEPIKIYDLAQQMIQLAGYIPNVDIPIEITGLRPGEKLHEALVNSSEKVSQTEHPQIVSVQSQQPSLQVWQSILKNLQSLEEQQTSKEDLWMIAQDYKKILEAEVTKNSETSLNKINQKMKGQKS